MRSALWPDSADDHYREIEEYFSGGSIDIVQSYFVELEVEPVGFIELNIRSFAEGSRKPRVPYVEAWYIKPQFQGRGFGKRLMSRAEQWALEQGFDELASDTEIWNQNSIDTHRHLGFDEVDRVVCFLKKLGGV